MTKKAKPAGIADTFEAIRNDYEISKDNRFNRRRTGLAPQGNTADWHYRNEESYYRDIEKARDVDRNDSIVGQTINRAVDNIVQQGFTLDVQTGDKKLDEDLKARWEDWANDPEQCDIQGEFTFRDFERHAMRSVLVDGDIVFTGIGDPSDTELASEIGTASVGTLQAHEAHTIRYGQKLENTFLGITRNDFGRRQTYWVIDDPNTPLDPKETKSSPLEVRDTDGLRQLFHVYQPGRLSQTRGVTALAPIINVCGMRDDIQFAQLVQRQVASCFAVFRKRQYVPGNPHDKTPGYGNSATETSGAGETRYIENIAPGMEIIGEPGEELSGFSPDIPGSGYEFQLKEILTTIGVNLGLPLCLVLMDGSETNFTGWRGAVDEARKGFVSRQRNETQRFHRPVWVWRVSQWLKEDQVLAAAAKRGGISIFGHKWNAPTWQYINPKDDAEGDTAILAGGLNSPRRVLANNGFELSEIQRETIEDHANGIRQAKQAALDINSEFDDGQPVTWRDLLPVPMAAGVQMSVTEQKEPAMEPSPVNGEAASDEV